MSNASALPLSGLKNLGHTCGLNAIVHILAGIPKFREAFSSTRVGKYLPVLERTRAESAAQRKERKERVIAALVAARQSGHRSRARSSSTRLERTVQDGGSEIINHAIEISMVENLVRVFDLMNSGANFVDPSALYFAYLSVESAGTVAFEELDAPQVLLNLLNTLHQDLVRGMAAEGVWTPTPGAGSLVSHFFRGATAQVVQCGACGAAQTQEHAFQGDIIVKIPTTVLPLRRRVQPDGAEIWERANLTVVDCMKSFVDGEIHGERTCAKCSQAGAVSVFNAMSYLPEVVVLYLSRGEFTDGKSAKHPVFVDVDPEIDFAPFLLDPACDDMRPCAYVLQGVVVHHGRGTGSGHFTSYVNLLGSGDWVHCNDTEIQPVRNGDIQATLRSLPPATSQPILLFYVRRSPRPTPLLGLHNASALRSSAVVPAALVPLFIDSLSPPNSEYQQNNSTS